MTTELLTRPISSEFTTDYGVTDDYLAMLRTKATGLKCDTPAAYEVVRSTIAELRDTRVAVEKKRVELKADALEYGRKVDSEAKRITAALVAIEEPLKTLKDEVDKEKERVKAERAAAIQRQLEEAAAVKRAAEDARLKAERDAEEARLAVERAALAAERQKLQAEQRAEAERLRIEREKMEAERAAAEVERQRLAALEAEKQLAIRAEQEAREKAERERVAEERRLLEAERAKLAAEEAARQAAIKAEREAVERVERERIETERRAVEAAELQKRLEAARPDQEKLKTLASVLRQLPMPTLDTEPAKVALLKVVQTLNGLADGLEKFGL